MHPFPELANRCASFTLGKLQDLKKETIHQLQFSGATILVKTLQIIRLEKAIQVVGTFSLFDALLQERLNCNDGFKEAKVILTKHNKVELLGRFTDVELVVNALKHGKGKSYNTLIGKDGGSFKTKLKGFDIKEYEEGDVSEITTLIDVDDELIHECIKLITEIAIVIEEARPGVFL